MLRFLDVVISFVGLMLGWPVLVLIALFGWWDTGSPIFLQERVGRCRQPFKLVKFRTMRLGTASVATHLIHVDSVTSFGRFLRRTKLDELPQLLNVLSGDMSLVGPRPCLPNQIELISAREAQGALSVRPGITGLAQLSGIDMSTPELLAQTDAQMVNSMTVRAYLDYIYQTLKGKGAGDRVRV